MADGDQIKDPPGSIVEPVDGDQPIEASTDAAQPNRLTIKPRKALSYSTRDLIEGRLSPAVDRAKADLAGALAENLN